MKLINKLLIILGIISMVILAGCSQKAVEPTTPVTPEPVVQPIPTIITSTIDSSILDENDVSVSVGEII